MLSGHFSIAVWRVLPSNGLVLGAGEGVEIGPKIDRLNLSMPSQCGRAAIA